MSSFTFNEVQLLNLREEDQPQVQFQNGIMTLMASRNGDQIMITAPIRDSLGISEKIPKSQLTSIIPSPIVRKSTQKSRHFKSNMCCGEKHPKAKLTENDIREMRSMAADKAYQLEFSGPHQMYMDLAKIYGIHYTTVYKIVNNQSWKHVANV